MEALLLESESKKDLQLLKEIANKMGLKTRKINIAEMEDIALANAMKTARTGKYVDTEKFLQKLKAK